MPAPISARVSSYQILVDDLWLQVRSEPTTADRVLTPSRGLPSTILSLIILIIITINYITTDLVVFFIANPANYSITFPFLIQPQQSNSTNQVIGRNCRALHFSIDQRSFSQVLCPTYSGQFLFLFWVRCAFDNVSSSDAENLCLTQSCQFLSFSLPLPLFLG